MAIHIALAKGRIAKAVMAYLLESGYCFPTYTKDSRKLIFVDDTESVKVTLVKSPDVPVYVERGAADVGIVGKDVLMEDFVDVYEVLDLGIGKCRMAVAGVAGYTLDMTKRLTVGTKYPKIAKRFFAENYRSVDIIKLNGSVELAPLVGLSDVIVDIVETGTTLKENGLEVIEYFMNLSARLICNKVSFKVKTKEINELISVIKSHQE